MSEKTVAQRRFDEHLGGNRKSLGVFVAGSCEHLLEGACSVCIDAELAVAEERGRRRGLEEAAKICEAMVVGGRAWTADQAAAADVLFAAAGQIRMGLAPRDSRKEG